VNIQHETNDFIGYFEIKPGLMGAESKDANLAGKSSYKPA